MKRGIIVLTLIAVSICCFACAKKAPIPSTAEETIGTDATANATIIERMDTSYEELLAAAVLVEITLCYPDAEPEVIYFEQKHAIEDKNSSTGVYVFFSRSGEQHCIQALPLQAPRTEAGTKDLKENSLGYATFDLSERNKADFSGYEMRLPEELNAQIAQLMLLTLIEN